MTRAEILDCLTDRPCDSCKFHESGRCERWDCVFEEKPDDCEDAISRQAVLDLIADYDLSMGQVVRGIHALPSVTPQQKTGHWKVASDGYGDNAYICECSECKDTVWVYKDADRKWNYCPNCGAKMAESEGTE